MIHIKQDLIKKNKVKTVKVLHVNYNEKGEMQDVTDLEIYRYKANGNIYRYNDMQCKKDFIYNKKDLLVTTIVTSKNSRGVVRQNIHNYNYDKHNNLVSTYRNGYLEKLYKPGIVEYYINDRLERKYTFNDKGLNTKREYYTLKGDIFRTNIYEYDNEDRLIRRHSEQSTTEFFYNEDGKLDNFKTIGNVSQESFYYYEDNKIKITEPSKNIMTVLEYDENELLIKKSFYRNENLECEHIIEYTYYN